MTHNSAGFTCRLVRLVRRFLDAGAVPFLGSGISCTTTLPADDPDNSFSFRATIDSMRTGLRERLEKHASGAADHLKKLKLDGGACSFDRLASVATKFLNHAEICESIGIRQLARLEPAPAHRYLAYLAREGLTAEIITTNFDTCLETAFKRTFRPHAAKEACLNGAICTAAKTAPMAVVANLDDYRRFGGRSFLRDEQFDRPILRVYKINGCAQRFVDAANDERRELVAKTILLTEEQLHTLDSRPWTKDLFRDRARSRSLVFSGFGSDEAQIRYSVLALLQEFATDGRHGDESPNDDSSRFVQPNAPWVAAYDSELSFSQAQILSEFLRSHGITEFGKTQELAFTGHDVTKFLATSSELKLSADLFWNRIFQAVFLGLVWRHSGCGSAFYVWLMDSNESTPELARRSLLEWLDPLHLGERLLSEDEPAVAVELRAQHHFGRFNWLLDEAEDGTLQLSVWLLAMLPPVPSDKRHNFYCPMREDSLFVLATLWLLFRLVDGIGDWRGCVQPSALGLKVTVPVETKGMKSVWHLARGDRARHHTHRFETSDAPTSRLLRVVLIPSVAHAGRHNSRVLFIENDETPRLMMARCENVSASELGASLEGIDGLRRRFAESPRGRQTRARIIPVTSERQKSSGAAS